MIPLPWCLRWLRLGWAAQRHRDVPRLAGLFLRRATLWGAERSLWSSPGFAVPLVPRRAEPALLAPTRRGLRGRGRQCRSPGPPSEARGPAAASPRCPGLRTCTCCLAPARGISCAGKEKLLGAFWGFPRESLDLGIFCPARFSPPSSSSGSHSHASPGVTNGFKKSNSPHNALPFSNGRW